MAKKGSDTRITHVVKRTTQGGKIKRAALNKAQKRNYKKYRGQGK